MRVFIAAVLALLSVNSVAAQEPPPPESPLTVRGVFVGGSEYPYFRTSDIEEEGGYFSIQVDDAEWRDAVFYPRIREHGMGSGQYFICLWAEGWIDTGRRSRTGRRLLHLTKVLAWAEVETQEECIS